MAHVSPEFDWDAVNRYQLGRRHVIPEEAQHAIRDPHAILLGTESDNGADRTKAIGRTASGRLLGRGFCPSWRGHQAYHGLRCLAAPAIAVSSTETNMSLKFTLPTFRSEAEEAESWDRHREETAQWMEAAVTEGETTTLSGVLARARQRSGGAASVTIRVDPPDAERARSLAAQKGIPCETYLKTLLHDALDRDERHPT
jgi:predicted DNA binding CopG/RHH family protein/uncharacterized DUF497 family protein